jgi:hypothetical protein
MATRTPRKPATAAKKAPAKKAPARKPATNKAPAKKAPAKRPSGRARMAAKKAAAGPVVVIAAPPTGELAASVEAYIASRTSSDDWTPRHDALADTAKVLARTLEDGAGLSTAAVARELRATLADLAPTVKEVSALEQLVARLSAPLGDTEEP